MPPWLAQRAEEGYSVHGQELSVVVARLKEINALVSHEVHQPVLLRHAPRPTSVKVELQRLRFPNAVERIPQNGLHEFQDSKGRLAFRSNPVV
jgi:hypothetical protein